MANICRAFLIVTTLAVMTGCSKKPEVQSYKVEGTVISIDKPHQAVMIDAKAIPNYMEAMAMSYSLPDARSLDSLKAGDQIDQGVCKCEHRDAAFVCDSDHFGKRRSRIGAVQRHDDSLGDIQRAAFLVGWRRVAAELFEHVAKPSSLMVSATHGSYWDDWRSAESSPVAGALASSVLPLGFGCAVARPRQGQPPSDPGRRVAPLRCVNGR